MDAARRRFPASPPPGALMGLTCPLWRLATGPERPRFAPPAALGTICGICWMAPKAAAKLQVNISVVMMVVRRNPG